MKGEVMNGKRILYATNLSEPTFKVLEGLSGIGEIGLREIILLYALDKTRKAAKEKSKERTRELFQQWVKRLNDYGINAEVRIESGRLADAVINTMHGQGIPFIVLHVNKESECSVVRNLIEATYVPVLVVDKDEKRLNFASKGIFERVLFATDWSPSAEKALRYILGFKELISELDIVNVIYEKLTVRALRQLKERLTETRNRCVEQGIEAEYHLYAGETAAEIMLAAQDYDATAIVMGTTPRQRFRDLFLGRPSCRVAERATVPTLIVP